MTPHHASVLRDAISTSSMAPQDERNPKHSPSLRRNRQRRALLIRPALAARGKPVAERSEEHTSELQSLMRNSYAVFCLQPQNTHTTHTRALYIISYCD